jgi:thioredoxin reductase (NADPH)
MSATNKDSLAAYATRRAQMFPTMSAAELARCAKVGTEVALERGSILFEQGEENVPFYVILEGAIEVVHPDGTHEDPITVHGPLEFTGEVNLLSQRRSLVRARAKEKARLLRVEVSALRALVQNDPELSELLLRAFILRRVGLLEERYGDAVLVGSRHSAETLRAQEFLTRNGHPYRCVDVDTDPGVAALLEGLHLGVDDVPVLICRGEKVLKHPTNAEIADCLGFNASIDVRAVRDVVVVGAGPGGLAAAVYAASEGLDVLVVEANAPGGQAGSSSKIENYLGFPTGISGQALAARAFTQAEKFGASIAIARGAVKLDCDAFPYEVKLDDGQTVHTRAIVIATGAEYRKLEIENLARFEGVGVYYGATFVEAQRCQSDDVIVVGGGNSAGQAAMFLSKSCRHVHVLVRGRGLAASMSRYLIRRIEETPNVTIHARTRIVALAGSDSLERVTFIDDTTGTTSTLPIGHIFSMTGAKPQTEWLAGCLLLDDKGFILTGSDLPSGTTYRGRRPMLFETSLARVFAVGDVRANSVKRVASAVGEGSVCVQLLHKALAE